MPCQICNDFRGVGEVAQESDFHERPIHGTRHHERLNVAWKDFLRSAESCYICEILIRGIRGCFHQHRIHENEITRCNVYFFYQHYIGQNAVGDKEIRFELSNGRIFEVHLFAIEGDDCPITNSWEYIPVCDRTSAGTGSGEALLKVRSWLSECDSTSHEFCDIPNETELPRRVVDVGRHDDEAIKIIETQGRTASYICLSHCRGQSKLIKSTRRNLPQRMDRIPLQDLSNTFRDAVMFTRRLGISYIWIDSLCIIQDDLQDWKVESAKMVDIYSKAYLTLAATSSPDGSGGLFFQTPDFEISGLDPSGEPYKLFFRERIDHHLENTGVITTLKRGHSTFTHHPLLTRAWVYQERLLSTRVLHFGHYELFFECRSDLECECRLIYFDGSSSDIPVAVTKLAHADALDSILPGADWAIYGHYYIARLWRTMATSYTALDITFASDRLSAIGGLAKDMASRRKSAYLAGLWKDTLSEDLLWAVWTTEKKSRPSSKTAPTWSWASVDTHVRYHDEILYWDPDSDYRLDGKVDYEHFAKVEDYSVAFPDDVRLAMKADYLLDEPGPEAVLPGTKAFCLRMSRIRDGNIEYLVSLVLKSLGNSPGLYARIGAIYIEAAPSLSVDPLGGVFTSTMEATVTVV